MHSAILPAEQAYDERVPQSQGGDLTNQAHGISSYPQQMFAVSTPFQRYSAMLFSSGPFPSPVGVYPFQVAEEEGGTEYQNGDDDLPILGTGYYSDPPWRYDLPNPHTDHHGHPSSMYDINHPVPVTNVGSHRQDHDTVHLSQTEDSSYQNHQSRTVVHPTDMNKYAEQDGDGSSRHHPRLNHDDEQNAQASNLSFTQLVREFNRLWKERGLELDENKFPPTNLAEEVMRIKAHFYPEKRFTDVLELEVKPHVSPTYWLIFFDRMQSLQDRILFNRSRSKKKDRDLSYQSRVQEVVSAILELEQIDTSRYQPSQASLDAMKDGRVRDAVLRAGIRFEEQLRPKNLQLSKIGLRTLRDEVNEFQLSKNDLAYFGGKGEFLRNLLLYMGLHRRVGTRTSHYYRKLSFQLDRGMVPSKEAPLPPGYL